MMSILAISTIFIIKKESQLYSSSRYYTRDVSLDLGPLLGEGASSTFRVIHPKRYQKYSSQEASELIQVDRNIGHYTWGGVAGSGTPAGFCAGAPPAFRVIDRRLPATTLTSLMGRWFCCALLIQSLAPAVILWLLVESKRVDLSYKHKFVSSIVKPIRACLF